MLFKTKYLLFAVSIDVLLKSIHGRWVIPNFKWLPVKMR